MTVEDFMGKSAGEIPDDEFYALQVSMKFFSSDELKKIMVSISSLYDRARWQVYSNELIRRYLINL